MANTTDNSDKILEKRRKRRTRKSLFLIPKIFAVFAVVFLLISIVFRSGDTVRTYTAQSGSIEEYVLADGYIFRDLEIVKSPADGYFGTVADEGERVTDGATVAVIYKEQVDPAVAEEISQLEQKIEMLKNDDTASEVYSGGAVKIELNISDEIRELTKVRDENDLSVFSEYKQVLDEYISEKQYTSEDGKTKAEHLNELETRLASLRESENIEREWVYSPRAGVFSSKLDGYEEALGIDMVADVTPSYLKNIERKDVSVNEAVTKDEEICKVVDNYEWYFVGLVTKDEAAEFDVGQTVSIRFYDLSDSSVEGEVTAISKEEDGMVAVTVYSTRYVDSIYTTSKVSAELLTENAEGIKVPSEALRVINGQQGLYVVRLGVARFVPVDLVYNNNEWAIVDAVESSDYELSLKIYDEVIVNTKGIEDGKVVRQ